MKRNKGSQHFVTGVVSAFKSTQVIVVSVTTPRSQSGTSSIAGYENDLEGALHSDQEK